MRPSEDCWECSCFVFYRLWATLSYVMPPSEDCWECRMYRFSFSDFEQHWVILCTHLRTAWSAECSYFCRRRATLSHLMLPSEDCWESRCYCFYTCFEQHLVIFWIHPGSTRFININRCWATLSHLPYPSEDCWGRAHLLKNSIQLTPIGACPGRCGEPRA